MTTNNTSSTYNGINRAAHLELLSPEERNIIDLLSRRLWYVTRIERKKLGECFYNIALIKPTDDISQTFNLTREIVVIFSSYQVFEPRAFDVLDELNVQELRLEEICSIIISKDPNITKAINDILKSNQESRIFIPFSYGELHNENLDNYFLDKMRRCFFSRDLFGIQDPLKKELYFFGRRELIQELVNKNLCGENTGIFGLRKTGKTSILYGVERALDRKQSISTFIDCQTLHNKPWNLALRFIIECAAKTCQIKKRIYEANFDKYENEAYAADFFFEDMNTILTNVNKKNILLIFDEIENITFGTSVSETWNSGYAFIKFWQSIRSAYQRQTLKNKFTYLIAGTNPRCVEVASIGSVDNPIFNQFNPIYIEPFNLGYTTEMLNRLGGYMGLKFSKEVCTHIVEDFGGHPLLMRQICSYIHRSVINRRPISINTADYLSYKQKFYNDQAGFSQYANMILEVLLKWYKEEYDLLEFLAIGDLENFKFFAEEADYIKHLKCYGIIEQDNTDIGYHFKIEALKDYLCKKSKHKQPLFSNDDREQEIQLRRSRIEKKLREFVKLQLKANLGENDAKEVIIKAIYKSTKEQGRKYNLEYKNYFDPSKHNIHLKTLLDVILNHYDLFEKLFNINKKEFDSKADLLNRYRRVEAHSYTISDSDFNIFRGIASWFEDVLEIED